LDLHDNVSGREITLTTKIVNPEVYSYPEEALHTSSKEPIKHLLWGQPRCLGSTSPLESWAQLTTLRGAREQGEGNAS